MGPLAVVEDGDTITIDIPIRRLDTDISDEQIDARFDEWDPPEPIIRTGRLQSTARCSILHHEGP